jgi:hypothetical protein
VSLLAAQGYPGITGIEFDPALGVTGGRTNTIFAASYGNGVYESTDAGATWSALTGSPLHVEHAAISSTGVYYVTSDNNLWSFKNSVWTELLADQAGTGGNGIHAIAVDPFTPAHILIATPGGNIDQSFDGGVTWTGIYWLSSLSATDIPWLGTIGGGKSVQGGDAFFDPQVKDKLWQSGGAGMWYTMVPTKKGGGNVWISQSLGVEQLVTNEIISPPGGKPVVANWDFGVFYVNNTDVFPAAHGTVNGKFAAGWSIDWASSNPSFIVGLVSWWNGQRSGYSTDGGQTWTPFPTYPPSVAIGGSIAAASPTDFVWVPENNLTPYYTKDGGATWNLVNAPGSPTSGTTGWGFAYYLHRHVVAADRVNIGTFYLFNNLTGLYRSTDGGTTWTLINSNANNSPFGGATGFNAKLKTVPNKAGNLFFTAGPQGNLSDPHPAPNAPFLRSTDGGFTWTRVPNVFEVRDFGFGAPATSGGYPAIYIAGFVNNQYGIWISTDNAQTWTQIGLWPINSLDGIAAVSGDMNIFGRVYIGFGGSGYAYGDIASSLAHSSADTTPPVVTITAPSGQLAANTGSTALTVTTSVNATCAWSNTANVAFASMTAFTTTGLTSHSTTLSGLANGTSYTTYVKCKDTNGNISADSPTSYSVASASTSSGGPIGFWPLDAATTNFTSNQTSDTSGSGNTGTLILMSSATSSVTGQMGQALVFNGSSQYVKTTNTYNGSVFNHTYSAWINRAGNSSVGLKGAVEAKGGGAPFGFEFAVFNSAGNTTNNNKLVFTANNISVVSSGTITNGQWVHAVATVDGSGNVTLYQNGVLNGTGTLTYGGDNTRPFDIGFNDSTDYFNGAIDDVRIYNRALSASEVSQLYNGTLASKQSQLAAASSATTLDQLKMVLLQLLSSLQSL